MRRLLVIALLVAIVTLNAEGQDTRSWEQVVEEMTTIEDADDDAASWEESYELLEQLAAQPLDLNRASREDLEQLPFLSAQQVMDIEEYRHRYGPVRSMGELHMVPSLGHRELSLLPFFIYVTGEADAPPPDRFPSVDSLLRGSQHTLSATVRVPFYRRQGDRDGYLGYPYRHTLRYELNSSKRLRAGLVAAQDAGEPFFTNGNQWGYDHYSYYLQLKRLGCVDNMVVGMYKLSAGMGLVLGQSFQLGKLATLQSLGRQAATIRPHSSRSVSDYFQGAAATVRLSKPWTLSAFLSHRATDATLTDSGAARTLVVSGYHRTPAEMEKKNNTHLTAAGARVAYRRGGWQMGATAIATTLDRQLEPQRQTLFRRHYAHGRHFLNASIDYAFTHHLLALRGESATDGHGALATINSVSVQPSGRFSIMALQRFYSYRYTTLHGHSFSAGSQTQNESGIYIGITWRMLPRLLMECYADYAYFPWARYGVSQTSEAFDSLLQLTWQRRAWTIQARHRTRLRQKDNNEGTALVANNDHRERFSVTYQDGRWTVKTQIDFAHTLQPQASNGWLGSLAAAYSTPAIQLTGQAAVFSTGSYASRIYLYERQLQHEFYFPVFYGSGLRLCGQAKARVGSRLMLSARVGYTNYFDRPTIGSGLQAIGQSHQTDLDVQVRWQF